MALTNYVTTFNRSPYYFTRTGVAGDIITMRLYIWNFSETEPSNADPTHTMTKAIYSGQTEVSFNVSGLVSDFFNNGKMETVNDQDLEDGEGCYYKVIMQGGNQSEATVYRVGLNGFGYHTQGMNPNFGLVYRDILHEKGLISDYDDSAGSLTYVHLDNGLTQKLIYTGLISGTVHEEILVKDVGTFLAVHPSLIAEGNKVEFYDGASTTWNATFKPRKTCQNTPFNIDFINKYGAWQRLVFYAKSTAKTQVKSEMLNARFESLDYNRKKGNSKRYNVNGRDSLTLNSGFVHEDTNEAFKQLMLSENIQIDGYDAIIKTENLTYKTSLNDKLINYAIEFEYAFNVINKVQ